MSRCSKDSSPILATTFCMDVIRRRSIHIIRSKVLYITLINMPISKILLYKLNSNYQLVIITILIRDSYILLIKINIFLDFIIGVYNNIIRIYDTHGVFLSVFRRIEKSLVYIGAAIIHDGRNTPRRKTQADRRNSTENAAGYAVYSRGLGILFKPHLRLDHFFFIFSCSNNK